MFWASSHVSVLRYPLKGPLARANFVRVNSCFDSPLFSSPHIHPPARMSVEKLLLVPQLITPHWLDLSESEIHIRVQRCTVDDLNVFLKKLHVSAAALNKDLLQQVFCKTSAIHLKRLASLSHISLQSFASSRGLIPGDDNNHCHSRIQLLSLLVNDCFGPNVSRCLRSIPPRPSIDCPAPDAQYLFQIPENIIRKHLSKLPTMVMRDVSKHAHPQHRVEIVYAHKQVVSEFMGYLLSRRAQVCCSSLIQLTDDFLSISPNVALPSCSPSDLMFEVLAQELGRDVVYLLVVPGSRVAPMVGMASVA